MNKLLISILFILLASCGFNSDEPSNPLEGSFKSLGPNEDFDGDFFTNTEEEKLGLNPRVADIPQFKTSFIQDFEIVCTLKNIKTGLDINFVISTKIDRNSSEFKYRVGELEVTRLAKKSAARIAKFKGHSFGEIKESDINRVSYPKLKSSYFLSKKIELMKLLDTGDYELVDTYANVVSNIKLKDTGNFDEIKDIKLKLTYYDFEKEKRVTLQEKHIAQSFMSGVNEKFTVKLSNLPNNLILDNLLSRGEFLESEITDFIIPRYNKTFLELKRSLKNKTVSVVINTPKEVNKYYIGASKNQGIKVNEVLSVLYDKNFEIQNNKIVQIGEFKNNLGEFEYLSDVKALDKKGQWFVMTKILNRQLIDYKFIAGDSIVLTYLTGNELARQVNQKITTSSRDFNTTSDTAHALGVATKNSIIEFVLDGKHIQGIEKKSWNDTFKQVGGSCGRNCVKSDYHCEMSFNLFNPVENTFSLKEKLDQYLPRIYLNINEETFSLFDLIETKSITYRSIDKQVHFKIKDIVSILKSKEVESFQLSLSIIPIEETVFNGINLVSIAGRDKGQCPHIQLAIAKSKGWPVSVESYDFGAWQGMVNWNVIKKDRKRIITGN